MTENYTKLKLSEYLCKFRNYIVNYEQFKIWHSMAVELEAKNEQLHTDLEFLQQLIDTKRETKVPSQD